MIAAEWTSPDVVVALCTLALAAATGVLAFQAWRTIGVQERQLVGAQRPYVYPLVTDAWLGDARATNPMLPIKNGGNGPAFNVQGAIYWTGGASAPSALAQTALAGGEETLVRILGEGIQVNFNTARGYLRYTDSTGREWQTHFRYAGDVGLVVSGRLRVDILTSDTTERLGEPQYNAVEWVNAPADVRNRWAI